MSYPLAGGFIPIIYYQVYAEATAQADTILTENNFDIMTELSEELLVE